MASVLDLVKHYQHNIEKYPNDENRVLKCIDKLFNLDVRVQHLQETGVGKTVNALRKEPGEVGQAARALVYKWKTMVAQEESENEEDTKDSTTQNGNGSVDSRSKHHRQDMSDSTPKSDNSDYKPYNGNSSGSKRKYHSSEEEEPDSKKSRHSSNGHGDSKQTKIKKEDSDSDSNSDESDSESSESESEEELKPDRKIKIEPPDTYEPSPTQNVSYNNVQVKKEPVSPKKEDVKQRSSHESSRSHEKSSKESSKTHSSLIEKSSKDKERSSDKKSKSEHKSSEKDRSKEDRHSSKHSDSEKHKSSSHKSENSKHKSHRENSVSKEKSSRSHRDESEKHKSSSEREDRHKSKDSSSSKNRSSSSKDKDRHSSKEKSSSHKSDRKHSSEKKSDSNRVEKGEKSSDKKSHKSSSSSSHKSSSKSKEAIPKKVNIKDHFDDEGIDCGSGASFADALGMVSTTKNKKKTTPVKDAFSPNNSGSSDLSPAALLAPTAKLAPLPSLEISALPEISPNYRPRPPPKCLPHFTEDDAMSAVISSKNQRTKVYSGNKVLGKVPTLYESCVNVLQEHIDALEYTGGVPYDILKPVVDRATPRQLFMLEHYNPYLMEDTDHLWQKFCEKNFRNKKRQEMETYREMYMRCQEEQEHKLRSLTANIKMTQEAKKAPIKQTKMAYVDTVVKPPRNIARKQALHGTAHAPSASPASRVASLANAPGLLRGGVRPPPAAAVSAAHFNKPKKAPLMQKALQLLRGKKR